MTFTTPPAKVIGDNISETDWADSLRGNLIDLDARMTAQSFSGCRATRNTDQNIATSSATLISWTGETFDVGGWFTPTDTKATVPAGAIPAGYTSIVVQMAIQIYWEGDSGGTRQIKFYKNGSEFATTYAVPPSTSQFGMTVTAPVISAVAGDEFSATATQSSGSTLKLQGSSQEHAMTVTRVGFF